MSQEKSSQRTNLWRPIIAMVFELWRAHPIAFIALIATTVIPGFSYIAYTLATRGLINALVESPTPGAWDIPTYMLLYIAAILVEMTMNMLRPIIMVYLRDHATHHIQSRIYEQATEAPLIRFEEGEFYDCLRRANNNLGEPPHRIAQWSAPSPLAVFHCRFNCWHFVCRASVDHSHHGTWNHPLSSPAIKTRPHGVRCAKKTHIDRQAATLLPGIAYR